MGTEFSVERFRNIKRPSKRKALRTVLLAVLFQVSWPRRLSKDDISGYLSSYYGDNATPALYRDLATLTGWNVEDLPEPNDTELSAWRDDQQRRGFRAITYERQTSTFGIEPSRVSLDINEDDARAS